MKKIIFLIILFSVGLSNAQQFSSRWSDLFSYNNVLSIREDNGKLIAATENGIFYYTISSGEVSKLSKVNGLHNVNISAFDYNSETKTALIGYANGSMDVITPEGITYIVDIPIARSFTGSRKINHIAISGDKAVISADYGISIFNLDRKEFGDSVFFSGVKESVLRGNAVYSATNSGIKKHILDHNFAIPSSWQTLVSGNFSHIDIDENLIAYASSTGVWYSTNEDFKPLNRSFSSIKDITINGEYISVTEEKNIYTFNNASLINQYTTIESLNTAWFNNEIFAGSLSNGILNTQHLSIKPDGPFANKSYKLHLSEGKIWVATGARTDSYRTYPDGHDLGFYFYNGQEWIYPSYFLKPLTERYIFNILDVVPNPLNDNEVFFANFNMQFQGQGFFRMSYNENSKDFEFQKYYLPPTNSKWFNRVVGFAFDEQNNLYGTISELSFDYNTSSNGYCVYDKSKDDFIYNKIPAHTSQKPIFYEGRLWVLVPYSLTFLIAVDIHKTPHNLNDDTFEMLTRSNNFPIGAIGMISLAFDKQGDAWMGTDKGLRILNNAATEITGNPHPHPIIITQNGIGEELFRDAEILHIEVDGSNKKWISVSGGGVYYLSADGQHTIHHFTKENSPLPNDNITDIKVDSKTGKVYFATNEGIVVYNGDITTVTSSFNKVLVYPNPVVLSQFKGNVTIKGLADKTNIRITDAAGNLVHQAVAIGGVYNWNLTNHRGKRVASGIYFVLMTNSDGTDKATTKIAIVN